MMKISSNFKVFRGGGFAGLKKAEGEFPEKILLYSVGNGQAG
jgi:hypothetical protein